MHGQVRKDLIYVAGVPKCAPLTSAGSARRSHLSHTRTDSQRGKSMRNTRRLTMIGLLLCGALVLTSNSSAQTRPPILEQIANTYGLQSFGQIDAIRYTWNGEIPGLFKV